MQKSYYQYRKEECRIGIDRMPIWFKETEFDGDQNKGYIIFQTENEYDEIWGPNAKMEISWEKKGRTETFHAKEVQASIDMYNAIKVVVTKKEMIWLRTHDFTYWIQADNGELLFYHSQSGHPSLGTDWLETNKQEYLTVGLLYADTIIWSERVKVDYVEEFSW